MTIFFDDIIILTSAKKISGSNNNYMGHCPCHSDKNPSLSIKFSNNYSNPILHCFGGCNFQTLKNFFSEKGLWVNNKRKIEDLKKNTNSPPNDYVKKNLEKIYNESIPISLQNLGGQYLKNRGLNAEISYKNVLFHPSICDSNLKKHHPCLISLVKLNEKITGLQQTFIGEDAQKLQTEFPRKNLGLISGGAVHLGENPSDTLHICEGVETGMAIFSSIKRPVWATLGINNLNKLIIPDSIKKIHIWADFDKNQAGQNGAKKAATQFIKKDLEVYVHLPVSELNEGLSKFDWLNVYVRDGSLPIQNSLNNTLPFLINDDSSKMFEIKQINTKLDNLVCLDTVTSEKVDWLMSPYFPFGKITIIEGDPGIGKGFLALSIAAAVSSGGELLGASKTTAENVLLLCLEDGLSDTIKPRLEKLGANYSKIFAYDNALYLNPEGKNELEKIFKKIQPRLMIIDPIVSVLGSNINMNKANDVREALNILIILAQQYSCCILIVRHLNKGDQKALYRGQGSIDFIAAARSALLVTKHPHKKNSALVFHHKSNLAPIGDSFGYDIRDGEIIWAGINEEISLEAAMSNRDANECNPEDVSSLEFACEFLKEILSQNQEGVESNLVLAEAKQCQISKRTLNRAKAKLKVKSKKLNNQWVWKLHDSNIKDQNVTNQGETLKLELI